MNVFLLWDNSRAEHGEAAELLAVCATFERAEAEAAKHYLADEDFIIEKIGVME